ncbi:MAG: sialate O-acetylesterase, partial [Mucilaginibacter sp.]
MTISTNILKRPLKGLLAVLLFASLSAGAKVKLPACITDNMVLQQKTRVNLWGKADAGKTVTIIPS